jgi:hypothetical protein
LLAEFEKGVGACRFCIPSPDQILLMNP